jgi:predicted GH43/DUF377 family glycosyl hydrolase
MTRYFLYFAGYDGATEQVGVAVSRDQVTWQVSPQPIIPVGASGAWDSWQTSNPCVLFDEGRFRMWYQGVDADGRYRIGYAESQDGTVFHKKPDVMFERPGIGNLTTIPRREGYHQPLVLRESERYRMYFLDHRDGLGYVRVAESSDGLAWVVLDGDCIAPEKSWESKGLHYPWVIHDGNQYVMWYTSEAERTRWSLNRAISEDGITWQRSPQDRPVIAMDLPRSVSRANWLVPRKLLRLFPAYTHPQARAIGPKGSSLPGGISGKVLATIHDRIIYPLRRKRYLSFNNSSVVRMDDGSLLMYYQALTENIDLAIGSLTSRDGIRWQVKAVDVLRDTIVRENITWTLVFDADPHLLVVED